MNIQAPNAYIAGGEYIVGKQNMVHGMCVTGKLHGWNLKERTPLEVGFG